MKITVEVSIQKVTPEIATEWLADRWGEQRSMRINHVHRLVCDMNAGRFLTGPDAIVRIKGKLANGQHRLTAVVESGKAQTFIVMESSDEQLYKVIDAGLKRTVGDALMGMVFARSIPSIARWVMAYEAQTVIASSKSASDAASKRVTQDLRYYPTQTEVIDYCISNKDQLTEACGYVNPLYQDTSLLPLSIGGAIHVIGHRSKLGDRTDEFLKAVYLGESATGSALDLRNRLIANRGTKAKLNQGYVFGISIKALRAHCGGTRLGVLKWVNGEKFPILDAAA